MAPTLPAPAPEPVQPGIRLEAVTTFFFKSLAGRLILIGGFIKASMLGLGAAGVAVSPATQGASSLGGLALAVGVGIVVFRFAQTARRRLLWRVRRKLILSYILIGVVPAVLIVTFFVLCGWLLFANLSSYLIRASLSDLAAEATSIADAAALELNAASTSAAAESALQRRQAAAVATFPGLSLAAVPVVAGRCVGSRETPAGRAAPGPMARASARPASRAVVAAGDWAHLEPLADLPAWVPCSGFSGVLTYRAAPVAPGMSEDLLLVIRAMAWPRQGTGAAVVVDVPFSAEVRARIEQGTGITIGGVSLVDERSAPLQRHALTTRVVPALPASVGWSAKQSIIPSVALLDDVDWSTGKPGSITMQIGMRVGAIYERLSASPASLGRRSFGDLLVIVLLLVAILFLIIEVGAAAMGLALAKSITGSIHELFTGTERVRQGDFGHRIAIRAKDQLGELADSFNLMTASIEDLLRQSAEKKRLEEEMRLAREIQMSLLPGGPLEIPGMEVAAVCVPAREVGGDYYDILPLPDGRVGILIADVSGKGMSAALYMAELKGLILSLSQIHASPRELLLTANRLISEHLDSRSFITMTYAVYDPAAQRFTYARAGHTPMLFLPGACGAARQAQILTPDGMVLGLRLDRGERFSSLLEEATLVLGADDLLVLFTDGISEAMNEQSNCFGEPRLAQLLEEHGDLPFDELRERILREIDAFVGAAPQHDDMTMILLKVCAPAPASGAVRA